LCEREGFTSFAATGYANLGWIAWKQNDLKQARALSQKALSGWSRYYPFCWYGLWTLIDLSLLTLRTDEAVDYARKLKEPGQQVFVKEANDLLTGAIVASETGDMKRAESLLAKAVDWAKKNHYL
jgi:Tfp pilus assembly protein PilF